jgi:hypothetical protein
MGRFLIILVLIIVLLIIGFAIGSGNDDMQQNTGQELDSWWCSQNPNVPYCSGSSGAEPGP